MQPMYILYVIPFFFLLMGIEWLYGYLRKKEYYRLNDSTNNLIIGIGNQVVGLVAKGLLFGVFIWVREHYRIATIAPSLWSFFACLILFDFLFYWAHRWGHEVNIFWGAHLVHHQSEEYNLSVALRQSWFHTIIAFPIFLPIPILGFDPLIFGAAAGIHTLYQFWIHTKAINKMPKWFEWLLNTPSHHRVHHSMDPKYLDKNHAGVFMIWDRLFGTFKAEEDADAIHYGITTQLKSWNPVWANFHYYIEMVQKASGMKLWHKVKMIWAKPGWMPDYLGGFQEANEVDENVFTKYDADTNKYFRIYAIIQFFVLLFGTMEYMGHYHTMSAFYKVVFFALLIITMLIVGAIFENKRWIVYAEYARLALVMVSLNTFYYFWFVDWFTVMLVSSAILFAGCLVFFTYSYIVTRRQNPALAE